MKNRNRKSINTSAADETKERIIAAAEELLRRYGPAKTRVVDVARHLGMSHANVYRHFESKAGIADIVAQRWLVTAIDAPLNKYVTDSGNASDRLRGWIYKLVEVKLENFENDPELFATYHALVENSRKIIQEHVAHLRGQLAKIISDGVESGEFKVTDIPAAARAVHEATTRFQHPFFISSPAQRSDAVKPVVDLLIAGLKAGVV